MTSMSLSRPTLTSHALRRWLPAFVRGIPDLLSAYLLPGRLPPRLREAAMLGVTSINRCEACEAFHGHWAARVGLQVDRLSPDEAAAYAYGQQVAISGPVGVRPRAGMTVRHRRELLAVSVLIELANLAGNRFLASPIASQGLQVGDLRTARLLDLVMRLADRAGLRRARIRVAGRARGDILEIGVGTGLNLGLYPAGSTIRGIDVSVPALTVAATRTASARASILEEADAGRLPFADGSFDTVVATFVLCSVDDVAECLREARRVLRPGGTIRLLEHARARHRLVGALQDRMAPAWGKMTGGCRLDHDVLGSVRAAGLEVTEARHRAGGLVVEIVAA
jgi:AhpD family alkylhydroperoxidase